MFQETISAIKGIKVVLDIAGSLLKTSKDTVFNQKVSEIIQVLATSQNDLLVAQANYSDLLKVKDEIEKKLLEYQNWEEEKRQYKLNEVSPKIFVYVYEPLGQSGEPVHWLCANCYTDNKKSILQLKGYPHDDYNTFLCKKCGLEVKVNAY